jgi:hypothetical protein
MNGAHRRLSPCFRRILPDFAEARQRLAGKQRSRRSVGRRADDLALLGDIAGVHAGTVAEADLGETAGSDRRGAITTLPAASMKPHLPFSPMGKSGGSGCGGAIAAEQTKSRALRRCGKLERVKGIEPSS